MIAEALQYLADLATKAAEPVEITTGSAEEKTFVVNGKVVHVSLPYPYRRHAVRSLEDLIALANRFNAVPPEIKDQPDCTVWYQENGVVAVLDEGQRRNERASLVLERSDVFARLWQLATAKRPMEQKEFVRLLRIELAGALDPAVLLNPVRKVRFENGSVTTAEVKRSRESMGREITSAVSAESEIPEDVTLMVPVYKTLGETERYPVRCTVETLPAEGMFRLLPYPDELERAGYSALGSIADRLAAGLNKAVPFYYGHP